MNRETNWLRVRNDRPCPICQHTDWCMVAADGSAALCARIEQGAATKTKGGWVHRLTESAETQPNRTRSVGKAKTSARKGMTTKAYPTADAAIEAAGRQAGGDAVAQWSYHGRDSTEALRVIRFALPNGDKQYRPIHHAKDGWRIADPSGPLPLYRLGDLPVTGTVWVTEGEKAADAAHGIGLPATTSAHGSGAAEKTDWTPLAGRMACILPDADEPGRKYAQDVARLLAKLDPPARVRMVELPGLPDKGDVVEYIDARAGQPPAAIRADVEAVAAKVPELSAGDVIGGPVLVCLADVEAREIDWLWPGRVALGRITLLVGRPGEGKSFLTTDMAARVTTGTPWPDGTDCPAGSVILVCAEDDPGDTIRPRLDAHHADVRRVHLLSAVRRIGADGKRHDVMFTLADVVALEAALKTHPDCKLIVVDPIGSFLGGDTDSHRDNEVRSVLSPVGMLAEKYGPAVLVVAHRRKSAGSNADETALGSRAFTGIARAVWHLSRDTENKARRLLLPGKNNLAPEGDGLAFTIHGERPAIIWERDPVTMSADDALAVENGGGGDGPGRPAEERDNAAAWLAAELADLQPHPVADLRRDATAAGIVWRTVQRAAVTLQVIRERSGFGGAFIWRLPKPGTPLPGDAPPIRATSPESSNSGTNGTIDESREKHGFSSAASVPLSHTCHNDSLGTNGDGRERGEL